MRRTASRAQRKLPITLVVSTRCRRVHRHLVDSRLALENAGVVDQRREAAEGGVDPLEHLHDVGFDADVTRECERLPALARDRVDDAFGRRAVGLVGDAHGVAARGGKACGRGADASAAAGHENNLVHDRGPPGARAASKAQSTCAPLF